MSASICIPSPAIHTNIAPAPTLGGLFSAYRWRLLATYSLFNLENGVRLLQPWLLGWAIDGLLRGETLGLTLFIAQHLTFVFLGGARRMYDTRVFTGIYTALASAVVVEQRQHNIEVSRVAARSALSREIVEFFERQVPFIFQSVFSVLGALVFIALCDWWLFAGSLLLMVAVAPLSTMVSRKTAVLNRRLNDRLEREVNVIERGTFAGILRHYNCAAAWRVRLSDLEAMAFVILQSCLLALVGLALWRGCATQVDAGQILAIFSYVLMFATGVADVPVLAQQMARLRDISGRLGSPSMGK